MKLVAEVDPKDRELCEKINEKQERYMMINLLLLFGAPTICCVLIVLGTLGILPREVSYVSSFFLPVIYIVLGVRTALEDHFICKKFSIKHDDLIQYLFYRELNRFGHLYLPYLLASSTKKRRLLIHHRFQSLF